jgi:hypothetical protein
MTAISLKAHRFMEANETSGVVYASVDDTCCVYRLKDGSTWRLSFRESEQVGYPRFAHLPRALREHRREELKLLARVEREAQMQTSERSQ